MLSTLIVAGHGEELLGLRINQAVRLVTPYIKMRRAEAEVPLLQQEARQLIQAFAARRDLLHVSAVDLRAALSSADLSPAPPSATRLQVSTLVLR